MEFRVGNRVRRVETSNFRVTEDQSGKIGKVIAVGGGTSDDFPYRVSFDENRYAYYYSAEELELVQEELFTGTVENALRFIEQLRERGDQPGTDFADILQPLVDEYHEMKHRLDSLDK
ncbi:Hypothetical Protein OBI_RACECAR_242 [Arthrobacter phage Racecar]|nr:hypothetical protein PBI_RACECAR_34 [Arthrobacter phage Racecar]QFG12718.1 hypothetical protein PBI_MIMI_34 [Arthrobacter phage Mimi]